MNRSYNYITVDNPKVPVCSDVDSDFAYAEFVTTQSEHQYEPEVVSVQARDMYLPHFSMRVSEGKFSHDAMLMNSGAGGADLLGSCLFPKGMLRSFSSSQQKVIECHTGTQNFKYDPQNEYRHWVPANTPFHIIHFSIKPDYFLTLLPDESWAEQLRIKIHNQERFLGERSTQIMLAQQRAIQTVFNCPLNGKLGELMIETSIAQVILLQLHALFQSRQTGAIARLSKRDHDIAYSVREHLDKFFLDDHSLEKLAAHFGTNTNKLMALFRKEFGKTIFEYLSEIKMDHAQQLLHEGNHRVAEIARALGYKNPNHFSAAFKKRFGIAPSQMK